MTLPLPKSGVVIIGRNEGERLRACLESIQDRSLTLVYVDSGSSDGSVALARQLGCDVVELDASQSFSAARARNAGVERMLERSPDVEFVQFVDGDCTLVPLWLAAAVQYLQANPADAVVCGRRRERFPQATKYNLLCDIEWNTPVGPAKSCGGDALMRVAAFRGVGGYDPRLIAGEEPELCFRLRALGWGVHRLDHEMTLHDAAVTRFGQWWRRTKRSGYAFRSVSRLHRTSPERFWLRETHAIMVWGMVVPIAILAIAAFTHGIGLLLLLVFPIQIFRIYRSARSRMPRKAARLFACYCVIGKNAEALGIMTYYIDSLRGRGGKLIEYKHPGAAGISNISKVASV
jgi:glycosyltransferase involved in cell wall biosynthesis